MPCKVLPIEVWDEISFYACLDNGYTGRSLSMASKAIRAASAPYKLQSISLKRAKYIFPFAQLLKDTPAQLRRVRHLSLSTPNIVWDDASDDERDSSYESDDEPPSSDESDAEEVESKQSEGSESGDVEHDALTQEEVRELNEDVAFLDSEEGQPVPGKPVEEFEQVALESWEDVRLSEEAFLNTVDDIITLCSSTLLSLSLNLRTSSSYGSFLSLPCPLPKLQELHWTVTTGFVTRVQREDIPIPSLKTLICNLPLGSQYRSRIMQLCPDITFLRGRIATDEFWEVATRDPPSLEYIPPCLTHYFIDVYTVDADDLDGDEPQFRAIKNELDITLLDKRIRFETLGDLDISEAEADWLDRLQGGTGVHQRNPFPISI